MFFIRLLRTQTNETNRTKARQAGWANRSERKEKKRANEPGKMSFVAFSIMADYQMDAPPRLLPRKKYCDVTGYSTVYRDKDTGLMFADHSVYQYLKSLPKSAKDQYLALRGVDKNPFAFN